MLCWDQDEGERGDSNPRIAAPQAAALTAWRRPPYKENPTTRFITPVWDPVRQHLVPVGRRSSLPLLLAGITSGGLLVLSNPGPDEFRSFAGAELSRRGVDEFCRPGGLPLGLNLLLANCPDLVRDQQANLGHLAQGFTRRWNLGLLSIYDTRIGSQDLLPQLELPGYHLRTLGVAGHFIVLEAGLSTSRSRAEAAGGPR